MARSARIDLSRITQGITQAAMQHGQRLTEHLMASQALSRRSAVALLRQLVELQWLQAGGTPQQPLYTPGALRQVVQRYALEGLQEDLPWRRDFAPCFALPAPLLRMVQHAFTELLNNAIEHSGGSSVTVSMRQTPLQLQLLVSDDGCGLFHRIAQTFHITDPHLALLELSKGKLSSAPARHSGQGLYFTARLADVLDLHANHAAFQRRAWDAPRWHSGRAAAHTGTSVYLAIALDTPRTLDEVLRSCSLTGSDYALQRTEVPLQLLSQGEALASRAQARRAVARLSQFARAEIDFAGIQDLGPGFADEMFRVFANTHPEVELVPVGMVPRVAQMVAGVLS